MDYKEKYEQALSRAKKSYRKSIEQGWTCDKEIYEQIFPELHDLSETEIIENLYRLLCAEVSIGTFEKYGLTDDTVFSWLKKQGEQKASEWHKEDEPNLNACLGYIPDEFLRKWLKDVIHVKYDKTAWSEEDTKMMDFIINILECAPDMRPCSEIYHESAYQKQINWLKSLKPRWKPTEEQMEALEYFVKSICESGYASPYDNNIKLIYSLLNEIKNLYERKQ